MSLDDKAIDAWLAALPAAAALPFWPPPGRLYSVAALYEGYAPDEPDSWRRAWDTRVYRWTLGPAGKPRSLDAVETVAARLHDAAIDRLVRDYLAPADGQVTIGFMGGHDVLRADPSYPRVARLARALRRRGFKIVTGGGPGLMEAANLGAFLAPHADEALERTLDALLTAVDYGGSRDGPLADRRQGDWIRTAALARRALLGRWDAEPRAGGDSLGIPTWYYGAEPPNLFASQIAKYFMNSAREDGLVSLANGGLVFGKGAAGTVQEILQSANYNYYRGPGVEATPMVFLDAGFWDPDGPAGMTAGTHCDPKRLPAFPLVRKLALDADPSFTSSLLLSSDAEEIVDFLVSCNAARTSARPADVRLAEPDCLRAPRGSWTS